METENTNEVIEGVEAPVEEPKPHELFEETFESGTLSRFREWFNTAEAAQVEAALIWWRRAHMNTVDDKQRYAAAVKRSDADRHATQVLAQRDRNAIQEALQKLHGDDEPFGLDWHGWPEYLRMAFTAGILSGHAQEAHALALNLAESFEQSEEIYDQLARYWRNGDGRFPDPVTLEQAVAQAWRQHYNRSDLGHPADPRLSDGWEIIWRRAKDAQLCDVFDNLAEALGVPRPNVTRSGYVRVAFSGYVDINVDEWSGTDITELIDSYTVADEIGAHDIDITDIEENLDWD